jgi:hypothetical protein
VYKRRSKAERRQWWYSLTDEERYAYQQKKMAEKPKRAKRESTCPEYPVVDDSNRAEWQARILRLNPWIDPKVFEAEELASPEDQSHMDSISQELRAG